MMDLEIFQAVCKALSNADNARGKRTTGLDGFGEIHMILFGDFNTNMLLFVMRLASYEAHIFNA